MNNNCLQTENLSIGYKEKILLNNLNLEIKKGEMVCLLGPNGVGKSTLIKVLTKILQPLHGEVFIVDENNFVNINKISPLKLAKHISIVLTEQLPSSNFTVKDIVSLGRVPYTNWLGNLTKKDDIIIENAMEKVNITHFKNRQVDSLSDGEKQRVMFAKALAQDTDLIILDEPTAHLDIVHRAELLSLLKKLAIETQKGILISTHELEMAIQAADSIWLIDNENELEVSSPEDLVLSGKFMKIFKGNHVCFNEQNGTFKIKNRALKDINLIGEGNRYYWTKHALEKKQYKIINKKSDISVTVKPNLWQLEKEGKVTELGNISALIKKL